MESIHHTHVTSVEDDYLDVLDVVRTIEEESESIRILCIIIGDDPDACSTEEKTSDKDSDRCRFHVEDIGDSHSKSAECGDSTETVEDDFLHTETSLDEGTKFLEKGSVIHDGVYMI